MSETSTKKSGDTGPVVILVVIIVLLGGALFGLNQWDPSTGSSSSGNTQTGSSSSGDKPAAKPTPPSSGSSANGEFKDKLLVGKESAHPDMMAMTPPEDLVVMLFPDDLQQQEQLQKEYSALLDQSPVYKAVLMADKDAWDALVERVVKGELDPDQVIGEDVQTFERQLREKLNQRKGSDDTPVQDSFRPETVFDKALTSRETKVSHIRKLLKHGAQPSADRARKLILTAQEEIDKLNKLKPLVKAGVDLGQATGVSGMTPLDATMVWGDITIAKYLVHKGAKPNVAEMRTIARTFQPKSRLPQIEAYLATLP